MIPLEAAIERYRRNDWLRSPGTTAIKTEHQYRESDLRRQDMELIADAYINQLNNKHKEQPIEP